MDLDQKTVPITMHNKSKNIKKNTILKSTDKIYFIKLEFTATQTHLEELTVWLVEVLRLILGLLFTTDSSLSFTAREGKGGKSKGNVF